MTRRRREQRQLEEGGSRSRRSIKLRGRGMEFVSFVGRVLFASTFLLSAYLEANEFGSDGGPAAKSLEPKYKLFIKKMSTKTGMAVPHVDIKNVIAATLYLRTIGAGFFILYSRSGAFLLLVYLAFINTVLMMGFYNYERSSPQYIELQSQFSQNLALYGALFFFWGMKNSKDKVLMG